MNTLCGKISLCLSTYRESRAAIKRQFRPDEIIEIQNRKLAKLMIYCYNNIKYYREIFEKAGIKPDKNTGLETLVKVPFLTKEDLRRRYWDFFPVKLPECRVERTSGSTGTPLCIFSDRNSRRFNSAAVIRCRQALGIGLIGRSILTPLSTVNEPYRKSHWTFLQGIHKTYYVNPYIESCDNIQYANQLLSRMRKPALIGNMSAIKALAYRIKDGVFPYFETYIILTMSESLSPEDRYLLEDTFKCKVADIYACSEAGDIAWQCIDGSGYHINADNIVIEIVNDDKIVGPNESGEVVITNLNRYAMPIIRYKNGDIARLKSDLCLCGRKLPMMAEIIGRMSEDLSIPNGKVVPWKQVRDMMVHPLVRQYQFLQNPKGDLTIRYTTDLATERDSIEETLLRRCQNLFGYSIRIKFEKTNSISPTTGGKSRFIIADYKASI
ncbi:phenylacetate--CoA ligase family protein [Planctomycetota bacterium]